MSCSFPAGSLHLRANPVVLVALMAALAGARAAAGAYDDLLALFSRTGAPSNSRRCATARPDYTAATLARKHRR